jgi:hypothetical protein
MEEEMKMSRNNSRNSSLVSIRKAPLQNVLSDANRDEKAQTPGLDIEALRTIGRIVRAIRTRIVEAEGGHRSDIRGDGGKEGCTTDSRQISGKGAD